MTISTRWFWLRHAPALVQKGVFVGKSDPPATLDSARQEIALLAASVGNSIGNNDCDSGDVFADSFVIPRTNSQPTSLLITSSLRRARATARALIDAEPAIYQTMRRMRVAAFDEQNFGVWEGRQYDMNEQRALWDAPATYRPPAGESFADLCHRVARAVERIESAIRAMVNRQDKNTVETQKMAIVVVAHAGTIRAAIAHALKSSFDSSSQQVSAQAQNYTQALSFAINPLSCTRIDHYRNETKVSNADSNKAHSVIHCVNARWGSSAVLPQENCGGKDKNL